MEQNHSHHNTTHEHSSLLTSFDTKAKSQEAIILLFFQERTWAKYSPSEIRSHLVSMKEITAGVPITSIRRAISNLTRDKFLTRTNYKVNSPYGRPEYQWRYRDIVQEQA